MNGSEQFRQQGIRVRQHRHHEVRVDSCLVSNPEFPGLRAGLVIHVGPFALPSDHPSRTLSHALKTYLEGAPL